MICPIQFKRLKVRLTYLCAFFCWTISGQITIDTLNHSSFITPEVMIGKLSEPNTDFPEVGTQKTFFLSFGKYQLDNSQEWAYRLQYPKTGFSLSVSDYGNEKNVGRSFSFLPYAEFKLFNYNRLNTLFGLGGSYHTVQFDIKENPNNKAISTEFSWAFRGSLLYDLFIFEKSKLRLSINYLHHSNGHVRLPNQGMNSFLLGASYEMGIMNNNELVNLDINNRDFLKSTYNYFSFRVGLGQNVLSETFNDKKEVYSAAFSYGKVINHTFKFGFGLYYRVYENYYDFIKNEEELILDRYPEFLNNPYGYASNIGFFGTGELLLNHIGVDFQMGINIYKPFYQVDWILNQGYNYIDFDENGEPFPAFVYGELDWYYEFKRTVSSRLGLKYYLVGTDKNPKHNFYVGTHINANLGQADFNELSFGYVYSFNFKEKDYSLEK